MSSLLQDAIAAIESLQAEFPRLIVAIDGRCAAGKTTLAEALGAHFGCTVLHMDDFFLQPHQRTSERLQTPGENIDHERFLEEVLLPLKAGHPFAYRSFDCHTMSLQSPREVTPTALTVVEGSYSCHPALWEHYDLRLFLDIDAEQQLQRIRIRNGERCAATFANRWIPLEEAYFNAYDLRRRCDVCLKNE